MKMFLWHILVFYVLIMLVGWAGISERTRISKFADCEILIALILRLVVNFCFEIVFHIDTQSPTDYLFTISIAFPDRDASKVHRHLSLCLTATQAG